MGERMKLKKRPVQIQATTWRILASGEQLNVKISQDNGLNITLFGEIFSDERFMKGELHLRAVDPTYCHYHWDGAQDFFDQNFETNGFQSLNEKNAPSKAPLNIDTLYTMWLVTKFCPQPSVYKGDGFFVIVGNGACVEIGCQDLTLMERDKQEAD